MQTLDRDWQDRMIHSRDDSGGDRDDRDNDQNLY